MISELGNAMIADQWSIRRALRRISGKASDSGALRDKKIDRLEALLSASVRRREARLGNRPAVVYPEHLPIFRKRRDIVEAVQAHQVVIVSGDTGSGKSTQIPKMCLEAGRGIAGRIGCTQPRRIAATAVARRLAEELGGEVGGSVGYKIRFSDRTGPESYIKILTDGMLLAETQQDRFLNEYDTIIIDEAHERSLNIDFLLGILRTLLPRRRDLKIIITSATLDTDKFSRAFGDAPVVEVSGRLFPVETVYMPPERRDDDSDDYVDRAVLAVEDLIRKKRPGDILVFMPTEQDIRETCDRVGARDFPETAILPLFARLPAAEQQRVFNPLRGRKIVVATNVAETSLTIPGIRFVIDTGLARIPRYLPGTRTTSLAIGPISRSSADQRKGRAGRLENGVCIRLYAEEDFERREEHTPPEILRSNLAEVILRMISLRLGDVQEFPFVDRPSARSVKDGFDLLSELGAVRRIQGRVSLTPLGRLMARLPLDPRIARMMIEGRRENCEREVSVVAAALGIQDPRLRPAERAALADEKHKPLMNEDSDFLTLLNIWEAFHRAWEGGKSQSGTRKFCKDRFLSFNRMREWRDIHEQITTILREEELDQALEDKGPAAAREDPLYARIHRSILSGFLSNIAVQKEKNVYRATRGREVMIFPGSSLFKKPPQWIVAAEMVRTTRLFARTAARIDPAWLEMLGGDLCRSNFFNPHWSRSRGEVRATEQVTLFGLVIVPGRSVSYGRIDPEGAHRIFVRSALVEGDLKEDWSFLRHNRALIEHLAGLEDRTRRRDILVSEQVMEEFYSARLPGVRDIRSLRRKIREEGADAFLQMKEEDLVLSLPDPSVVESYPESLRFGERVFSLTYRFEPGAESDGVTLNVPITLTTAVPSERLEWMVPGFLEEKITALVKGLPKRYRKQLVPVSNTVRIILAEMEETGESLITTLGRFLYRRFGVDVPASAWPVEDIPDHLKMRVAITDHQGRELRALRDPAVLRGELPHADPGSSRAWRKTRGEWEREGLDSWDFDVLPEQIPIEVSLTAYPALEPSNGGVNIRLFASAEQARKRHREGVAALAAARLGRDLKFAGKVLRLPAEAAKAALYFGGPASLESALVEALTRDLLQGEPRTRRDFEALCEKASAEIIERANDLLDKTLHALEAHHEFLRKIHAAEAAGNPAVKDLCRELRREVLLLMPGNFLEVYSREELSHLPRFLKAREVRLERGAYDPGKDRKKAEQIQGFEELLREMKEGLSPNATNEKRLAVERFQWMIEELRVSVFAPELTTAFKVSPKRLRNTADDIRRMV